MRAGARGRSEDTCERSTSVKLSVGLGQPYSVGLMGGSRFQFRRIEREFVAKSTLTRSPGRSLVDSCTTIRAGAVGDGPGPNCGRKPAKSPPKLKHRFEFPCQSPFQIRSGVEGFCVYAFFLSADLIGTSRTCRFVQDRPERC